MGHSPAMPTIGIGATSGNGGPFDLGPSAIYAAIDNPDALHKRAVATGTEIVMGVTDQEDGSREFAARDLEGNVWCFGTNAPAPEPALAPRRLGSRQAEFIRPARFTAAKPLRETHDGKPAPACPPSPVGGGAGAN